MVVAQGVASGGEVMTGGGGSGGIGGAAGGGTTEGGAEATGGIWGRLSRSSSVKLITTTAVTENPTAASGSA